MDQEEQSNVVKPTVTSDPPKGDEPEVGQDVLVEEAKREGTYGLDYWIVATHKPRRDYAATQIMAGMAYRAHDLRAPAEHAKRAVEWADALIAELEKPHASVKEEPPTKG